MHYLNDHRFLSWVLGLVAGGALLSVPLSASSESPAQHDQHISMSHQTPEWAERLKGHSRHAGSDDTDVLRAHLARYELRLT